MIELGQLEAHHAEFEKRKTRVVVVSLEDQELAQATQADFPHLVVVSDADRGMAEALKVIHAESNPHGGDTTAPTTILLDGDGVVRWLHRPPLAIGRLSAQQVLDALDAHVPQG
jgi:alkyl hydroperoxide reductase subunit AhpC